MTVCQLYAKKNSHRKNIKRNTEKGRKYLMDILKKDPLGARSIDTVKQSDAKEWCIRKNPFDFKLSDVLEDDTEPKIALTPEQEAKLLSFMESDKVYEKYRDEMIYGGKNNFKEFIYTYVHRAASYEHDVDGKYHCYGKIFNLSNEIQEISCNITDVEQFMCENIEGTYAKELWNEEILKLEGTVLVNAVPSYGVKLFKV